MLCIFPDSKDQINSIEIVLFHGIPSARKYTHRRNGKGKWGRQFSSPPDDLLKGDLNFTERNEKGVCCVVCKSNCRNRQCITARHTVNSHSCTQISAFYCTIQSENTEEIPNSCICKSIPDLLPVVTSCVKYISLLHRLHIMYYTKWSQMQNTKQGRPSSVLLHVMCAKQTNQ